MDFAAVAALTIAVLTFVATQLGFLRMANRDHVSELEARLADFGKDRDDCLQKLAVLQGTVDALRESNLFLMKKLTEGK